MFHNDLIKYDPQYWRVINSITYRADTKQLPMILLTLI